MSGDRNLRPPENDDGRPPPGRSAHAEQVVATTSSTPVTIKTSSHFDSNCAPRQCRRNTVGRYALGFADGFQRGRVDALRVAMNSPDAYELVADD